MQFKHDSSAATGHLYANQLVLASCFQFLLGLASVSSTGLLIWTVVHAASECVCPPGPLSTLCCDCGLRTCTNPTRVSPSQELDDKYGFLSSSLQWVTHIDEERKVCWQ